MYQTIGKYHQRHSSIFAILPAYRGPWFSRLITNYIYVTFFHYFTVVAAGVGKVYFYVWIFWLVPNFYTDNIDKLFILLHFVPRPFLCIHKTFAWSLPQEEGHLIIYNCVEHSPLYTDR